MRRLLDFKRAIKKVNSELEIVYVEKFSGLSLYLEWSAGSYAQKCRVISPASRALSHAIAEYETLRLIDTSPCRQPSKKEIVQNGISLRQLFSYGLLPLWDKGHPGPFGAQQCAPETPCGKTVAIAADLPREHNN